MTIKNSAMILLASIAFASCQQKEAETPATKFIDPANMDTNVSPGENFFLYANGGWLKDNEIPESETRWGTFDMLHENNMMKLHDLLNEAAAANAKKGTPTQKVGDFYKSGMDSATIDAAGLKPVHGMLARIDDIKTSDDVLKEVAKLRTEGLSQIFGFYISPDDKNVTQQICQMYQGGLGMPDRDYYFNDDERSTKIRDAYKAYQVELMKKIGIENPEQAAADVYALEEKLAKASMTRTERRDPYKVYNKYSIESFNKVTPGIDWKIQFANMKVTGEDSLIVGMPNFFKEMNKQLSATSIDTWKKYLKFHVVNDMAPYLSSDIDDMHFNFYGKEVRGQEAQKPRWKRVLNVVDGGVGELLGKVYVDKHFTPEAKDRMMKLVNNLQETYHDRIMRLDWMSDATKQKAIGKLNTFVKKIGYPDKWRDYTKLDVVPGSYVDNVIASANFDYDYMVSKLGKPVDRTEWFMTPPTVNAYYNPAFNEIVFPAGILAFPFFDMNADDAVNYGGIGGVIGHEMTHGFDDQGAKYAADGNLKNWWTEEDEKRFGEKTGVVVEQFNNYTVLDTVHVNGELTLGENLADLGGLAIAYEAFQKTEQAKKGESIDGFTPNQRFFLSWAQVWRANTRDEELANRIITDPHSPVEWRTNGPLSNMTQFYDAFGIKEGDKMWRSEEIRAKVW
ncbi:MAG: M13 family metallopeptidase [Chitinophagales bacterium]|nr:M13 family metallopeptidase [Chitinophagaceae bacterium]MCB9064763.1 M13 family metallopeptidase [Chitinophagales bacterium]